MMRQEASKWKGLRTSNLVYWWITKICITNKRHDLQGQRSKSRTYFRVKRSKVKVSRETESVSCLRSGKTYELRNWYADGACYILPWSAIKAYEVGFLHTGGDIKCRPNPTSTQRVIIRSWIEILAWNFACCLTSTVESRQYVKISHWKIMQDELNLVFLS